VPARLTSQTIIIATVPPPENERIIAEMLRQAIVQLNEKTYPKCYLHRSSPND